MSLFEIMLIYLHIIIIFVLCFIALVAKGKNAIKAQNFTKKD